ncbi:MAG: DUF4395 domain-containing protein [Proteobacteria bacterium]|nr:DUF4395 domain-containing protein [Pseudomonadota bacterium]
MSAIFQFGESVSAYDMPVLNEREARAGAGILLLIALVAFMNAWLDGNFRLIQLVVVAFFIDFVIRVLINPRFAPSLILGRIAVRNQTPEYTGAAQKRFAWALGLMIAAPMLYFVVLQGVRGPFTLLACLVCLTLLFFEAAFGICLGCMIYNAFNRQAARLCPGGVCEVREKEPVQRIAPLQLGTLALFLAGMVALGQHLPEAANTKPQVTTASPENGGRCKVPDFAKAIGHEQKWKLHNNCL